MKKLLEVNDVLAELPAGRRAKIEARSEALVNAEHSLRMLRRLMAKAQTGVAGKLKTNQAAVSKLEQRNDMLISTLRSYVEAIGGSLKITAELPGLPPLTIAHLSDLRSGPKRRRAHVVEVRRRSPAMGKRTKSH
ncbi:MAG: XRE family transcriptional regulator [Alphaproteobacteria bacterium]